jgi:hypothetical protein
VLVVRRDKWIHVKVSESERAEWQRLALAKSVSVADLVRQSVGGAALSNRQAPERRPARRVDPELIRELGRLGNNLNQVGRWANTYKSDADAAQVLAALIALEREFAAIRADHSPRPRKPEPTDAD